MTPIREPTDNWFDTLPDGGANSLLTVRGTRRDARLKKCDAAGNADRIAGVAQPVGGHGWRRSSRGSWRMVRQNSDRHVAATVTMAVLCLMHGRG